MLITNTRLALCDRFGLCVHWRLVGNEAWTAERFQRKQRLRRVCTQQPPESRSFQPCNLDCLLKDEALATTTTTEIFFKKWGKNRRLFWKLGLSLANKETSSFWKRSHWFVSLRLTRQDEAAATTTNEMLKLLLGRQTNGIIEQTGAENKNLISLTDDFYEAKSLSQIWVWTT